MNRTRQIMKKTAATALGISLVVSGSSSVFAAGSYQETEKAALSRLTENLPQSWDAYLENYQKASAGTNSSITLQVEDTGRALVGALMGGTDVSWLKTLSIDSNISIKDGIEAVVSSVLLNDGQICNFNVFMDLANMMEYIQIPELSDSYISAPISADSEDSDEETEQFMNTYMTVLSDLTSMLPDSKTVTTLLDRYGNIIIDNTEEGASVEESVSVDGISENCTAYEGTVSEKAFTTMTESILTTAKDDAEIKDLFAQWADASDGEDQYQEFQNAIEDALKDVTSDEAGNENTVFSSKVWVNADDKIVGREIGIVDDTDVTPVFTWKAPSEGDSSALLLEVSADDSSFTLTGSGKTADGVLNGDYILALDGTEAVDINVENLQTEPEKPGYYNGTFHLTFPEGTTEDDTDEETSSDVNPLAGFGVDIKLISDASSDISSLELTLTTSGAPLATLTVTGSYGDSIELPDLGALTQTYDATDDNDMTGYFTEANWDALLTNIKAAGVPEELAAQLEEVLQAAVESASQPEENDVETNEEAAEDEAA
ncbi:DUF6583 family protein [Blautia sp. MSJ-19]|uniref:DUF6583 family protein n=1 Tax=Blautia sp. MSJ-19 TaxID=2841517 RepID=UPI0020A087FF|nr:DUF6583 family protein [Blautia sp. MSJ-19]